MSVGLNESDNWLITCHFRCPRHWTHIDTSNLQQKQFTSIANRVTNILNATPLNFGTKRWKISIENKLNQHYYTRTHVCTMYVAISISFNTYMRDNRCAVNACQFVTLTSNTLDRFCLRLILSQTRTPKGDAASIVETTVHTEGNEYRTLHAHSVWF